MFWKVLRNDCVLAIEKKKKNCVSHGSYSGCDVTSKTPCMIPFDLYFYFYLTVLFICFFMTTESDDAQSSSGISTTLLYCSGQLSVTLSKYIISHSRFNHCYNFDNV